MVVVEPKQTSSVPPHRYLRAPVPVHFPSEEKVPESQEHLWVRTALWLMLSRELKGRAVVCSEQFLYWDPTDPKQCLAPDLMVWLGPPAQPVTSWKIWERGAPHLAVEVISAADARDRPWKRKFAAYQRTGVRELVRFNPAHAKNPLRFWDRVEGDLIEREVSGQAQRSDVLGLHWLLDRSPEYGLMLRFSRDAAGHERLLTGEEELLIEAEARRVEAEGRRIEAEARRIEAEGRRIEAEGRLAAEAEIRELKAELARRSKG